ncbi:hypothetical protein Gotur_021168 [Gossypium turneri]
MNYDASFNRFSQRSDLGIVFRDKEGFILAAYVYPNEYVADPMTAEAQACLQALVLEEDRSNVAALIKEIKERSRKFAEIIVSFAPRLANRMAHAMTEEGREFSVPAYWIEEVPIRVEEEVAKDRREYSVCTDGEGGRG